MDYRPFARLFARIFVIGFLFCFCLLGCNTTKPTGSVGSSAPSGVINLADPTIMAYKGKYYLTGTFGDGRVNEGFALYSSADLMHWHPGSGVLSDSARFILKRGKSYGTKGFWAPQLLRYQHKFVIAYTANEQIALAYNNTGFDGDFLQTKPFKPLFNDDFKHIDPFIFEDGGRYFIYYVKLDGGNKIYVSELGQDRQNQTLGPVRPGTERLCIEASQGWENTQNTDWPVTEGPTVIKHRGVYYLFYSANDFRNPDYAVGYATAASALGPWKKSAQNPLISRADLGMNGTGHGDVFTGGNGQLYYVFHVHHDNTTVSPRKTLIVPFRFKAVAGPDSADSILVNYKKVQTLTWGR